jgi:hypothetical protein
VAAFLGASLNAMHGSKPFEQYFFTGLVFQVLFVIIALVLALRRR